MEVGANAGSPADEHWMRRALALAGEVGNRRLECLGHMNLGAHCADQGLLAEARAHYERGLAIAREMGMTSPALYRYFASRDALATALIVDAYHSFAAALAAARAICPEDAHHERLLAVSRAYRAWARRARAALPEVLGVSGGPGADWPRLWEERRARFQLGWCSNGSAELPLL